MRNPERRGKLLFLAQIGVGVSGITVAVVVMLWGIQGADLIGIPIGVSIAVAIAGFSMWALVALERAKFRAVAVVTTVDWAEELREVRDSRRVIVAAFGIERRRIERDLHDGAQQYLVAATMKLGEASMLLAQGSAGADAGVDAGGGVADGVESDASGTIARLLEGAHLDAEEALRTLRATVSGIHPQVLSDLGLRAAVTDMAERSGLNVTVRCPTACPTCPPRLPPLRGFSVRKPLPTSPNTHPAHA